MIDKWPRELSKVRFAETRLDAKVPFDLACCTIQSAPMEFMSCLRECRSSTLISTLQSIQPGFLISCLNRGERGMRREVAAQAFSVTGIPRV